MKNKQNKHDSRNYTDSLGTWEVNELEKRPYFAKSERWLIPIQYARTMIPFLRTHNKDVGILYPDTSAIKELGAKRQYIGASWESINSFDVVLYPAGKYFCSNNDSILIKPYCRKHIHTFQTLAFFNLITPLTIKVALCKINKFLENSPKPQNCFSVNEIILEPNGLVLGG